MDDIAVVIALSIGYACVGARNAANSVTVAAPETRGTGAAAPPLYWMVGGSPSSWVKLVESRRGAGLPRPGEHDRRRGVGLPRPGEHDRAPTSPGRTENLSVK
ncbi:MAG TPA: hypothetical protein VNE61_15950 [Ktedonobacteraceae bacterium]|nr:hypothetical protein [Ktedonobacteraceae bacterium]